MSKRLYKIWNYIPEADRQRACSASYELIPGRICRALDVPRSTFSFSHFCPLGIALRPQAIAPGKTFILPIPPTPTSEEVAQYLMGLRVPCSLKALRTLAATFIDDWDECKILFLDDATREL